MPFLWSNPNPDDHTSAALSAGYKVDAPSIGPLVAAILQHRDREAAAANQQNQQMMQGIQSAIGAVAGGMKQGQQDDAANRAMYVNQYPQEAANMGQPGFDDRVPDYGGVDQLKMQQIVAHLRDPQLQDALLQSRIAANNALANQRTNYPPGSANAGINAAREDRLEQDSALKNFGITAGDLFDSSRHSRGSIQNGQFVGDANGDTFRIMGTDNVPHYLPATTFDTLKQRAAGAAATNYRTPQQVTKGINQNDVAQAAGAMGMGERGEPIPGATSSSTTSNKPGVGAPQEVIQQAQEAVRLGAPKDQVISRLRSMGIQADQSWF